MSTSAIAFQFTKQGLSDVSAVARILNMSWGVLGCLHWPELLYTLFFTNRKSGSSTFDIYGSVSNVLLIQI